MGEGKRLRWHRRVQRAPLLNVERLRVEMSHAGRGGFRLGKAVRRLSKVQSYEAAGDSRLRLVEL
jgi:hypothetical protein